MSKHFTHIESALREDNFIKIARLIYQLGKSKGYSIQEIANRLEEWVKDLRELSHDDDPTIAQMIDGKWFE